MEMKHPLKPTVIGSETYREHLLETYEYLWHDLDESLFPSGPSALPVLTHYTSAEVVRQVFSNRELWFSSPLFMNDTQELAFAMNEAALIVQTNEALFKACGAPEYHQAIVNRYLQQFGKLNTTGALDVFMFCMSALPDGSNIGLLSMWRGYGHDGNGVALVVNPFAIADANVDCSMIVGRVQYKHNEWQRKDLVEIVERLAAKLTKFRPNDPNDRDRMADALFRRVLVFALFTKHSGFSEEREWRLILLPSETSALAPERRCTVVSPAGLPEPRYKTKLVELDAQSVVSVIPKLIAGPAYTSARNFEALKLLISGIKHTNGIEFVASETPYRSKRLL
jgi:hypothetical protein